MCFVVARMDFAHFRGAVAQVENLGEWPPAVWGAVGVLVLAGLLIAVRLLRGRRRVAVPSEPDLRIDVLALGEEGPPRSGPRLELYHVPVRLAGIVLAPVGRGSELAGDVEIAAWLESLLPGLGDFEHWHRPAVFRWPAQLSTQGFANTLFAHARLPGDGGKGTPWSMVAGRFEQGGQRILAGLILCAEQPNALGQFVLERPTQWLDALRVVAR